MLRFFVVAVVLLVAWVHWRAAYTGDVRAALGLAVPLGAALASSEALADRLGVPLRRAAADVSRRLGYSVEGTVPNT